MGENIAQFIITNSTLYHAMEEHPENKLYFLADTEELYRGNVPFTAGVIFFSGDLPERGAERKLYINNETLTGYVWSNDKWTTIIIQYQITPIINADTAKTDIPNVEAIKKYIRTAISDMTYNFNSHSISYTQGDLDKSVVIGGILTEAEFDRVDNKLIFKNVKGDEAFSVSLPLDNFPIGGYYDEATERIIIQMRTNEFNDPYEIAIPASNLVKVRISETPGNLFKKYDDGYGVVLDISGKMDKVPSGQDGRILTAKEDGNANAIQKFVGGAHFSLTDLPDGRKQADPNTLATEAGVYNIISEINDDILKLSQYTITQTIDTDNPSASKYPSEVAIVATCNNINDTLNSLSTNLSKLQNDLNNTSQSSNEIKNENIGIKDSISAIEDKLTNNIKPQVNKIEGIEQDLVDKQSKIDELTALVNSTVEKADNVSSQFGDVLSAFSTLQTEHNNFKSDTTDALQSLTNAYNSFSNVQSNMENNFNLIINDLTTDLDTLTKKVNDYITQTSFTYYT